MVDSSEPASDSEGIFSHAFSPRIVDIHFSDENQSQGYKFEVRITHFHLLGAGFMDSVLEVWLEGSLVKKIEPPLLSPREFQQALKQ